MFSLVSLSQLAGLPLPPLSTLPSLYLSLSVASLLYIIQACLDPEVLLPQLPVALRLQLCATLSIWAYFLKKKNIWME